MNYKETLFFIGRCLTIPEDEQNFKEVSHLIKTNQVDWDEVVKLSSAHYVFTTLYCRLLNTDLIAFLPEELVSYMKHLTEINRDRNQQIIEQATELNLLLRQYNISPIFLKGTGNLLEGLYKDFGERMVGDIDFIILPEDYEPTIKILKKYEYKKVHDHPQLPGKHYPKLVKDGSIASVEIHKEMVKEPFESSFNYGTIQNQVITINNFSFLGYEDQLALSIIAKQINDDGFHYKNIALRNAYDVFLLSKNVNAKHVISKFKTLGNPLNCFLASSYLTFGKVDSLAYEPTRETNQ